MTVGNVNFNNNDTIPNDETPKKPRQNILYSALQTGNVWDVAKNVAHYSPSVSAGAYMQGS